MRFRKLALVGVLSQVVCAAAALAAGETHVESPDGKVTVDFVLQPGGTPAYKMTYAGKPIVLESRLGFEPAFTSGFQLTASAVDNHQGQWTNDLGERKIVPDNYRELNVDLKQPSGKLMRISFRAYNEGAAFRYTFPAQDTKEFKFTEEKSEFRFPADTFGYEEHGTEGEYIRAKIADMQPQIERPLTLEYSSGIVASLAEADTTHYPRMLLSRLPDVPRALVSHLGGTTTNTARGRGGVRGRGPETVQGTATQVISAARTPEDDGAATINSGDSTPWRLFVVGEKPGDLLERNYLLLNLNPPCAIRDTSWLKPGHVMRNMPPTTANAKAIIDLAPTLGIQYVLHEGNWFGSQNPATGDATTARSPVADIPEVLRYGNEHHIGLLLYVDRQVIKRQRDILFPLYEKWGLKGVKIGGIDVGPQVETEWATGCNEKAAEHHLMLNIHDGYRPTGNQRTWPNLMTVEGIQGNEHMPTPEHNCTLPFTRFIAGEADYTICYFNPRKQGTYAHQLAMAAVYFSPLTCLYWYDSPNLYQGEKELEFWRQIPTVWDDTKVINGKIGAYATVARRSGEQWFIGTLNNSQPRELQIPLAFLTKGKKYTAHLYGDDPKLDTRTKVAMTTQTVDSETTLNASLIAAGGQSIWLEPAN